MKFTITTPLAIHELGKRQNQEDAIFPAMGEATTDDRLFIVCDGMGGHESGEVASNTVCRALSQYLLNNANDGTFTDKQLNQALNHAYDALDEADKGHDSVKKMGTTLTLLKFHDGGCTVAHIGDSRIYHIRPSEHYIWHTRDHSLVNDLYEIGEISLEEMKNFPQKNVITRAMQPGLEKRSKATIKQITDVQAGDYFFLCSDGMLEETEDENLLNIFSDPDTTDQEKKDILIKVTEENRDNHSAYIIHVTGVDKDKDTALSDATEEKPQPAPQKTAPDLASPQQTMDQDQAVNLQNEQTPKVSQKKHINKHIKYLVFLVLLALAIFGISMIIIYITQHHK